MKKSRYTEEQIAFALKQAETGTPVAEVIRRMGISEQTFYRWKMRAAARFHADEAPGDRRHVPHHLRSAELLLPLDGAREIVAHVQASHGVSERRGCLALGIDRSSVRYVSHKPDQAPLRLRIHDLAAARMRYGYFRIYILLRREG